MKSLTKLLLAAALVTGVNQVYARPVTPINAHSIETQDRHLSGFSGVVVAGSFDVYITQGSSESVKVVADEDVINKIITEVKDGVLKIYNKNTSSGFNWNWNESNKMKIYVSAKDLNKIVLSGSGDVFFKDGIRTQNLLVSVSGSGDIVGKVDVKNLESTVVGSGDVTLTGRAETSSVRVSGSGDYKGRALVTANTTVKVVGSGDAAVYASQKLDAAVAGSGDIRYTGGAKLVASSETGSGEIHRF